MLWGLVSLLLPVSGEGTRELRFRSGEETEEGEGSTEEETLGQLRDAACVALPGDSGPNCPGWANCFLRKAGICASPTIS